MEKDKYHGQGGGYRIDPGTRERRLDEEPTKPEPAGGGARDKDGRPLEEKRPDKPEAAIPAPGKAPWDVEPPAPQTKKKGA
jgi:hypothetical protein